MLRISSSALLLALSLSAISPAVVPASPAAAQEFRLSPGAVRVKLKGARTAVSKLMRSLATWCDRNDFPAEAAEWRLRAVSVTPDDVKLRKKTGFVKDGDGWRWDESARTKILETLVKPGEGEILVYDKRVRGLRKRIGARFRPIAAEARKLADSAPDDDERAAFEELHTQVWETARLIEPTHQGALKALGHPELAGKYVHRDGVEFVRQRLERQRKAQLTWASDVEVEETPGVAKDLWRRVRAEDVTVDATWGMQNAIRIATAAVHATRETHRTLRLSGAMAVLPNLRTFAMSRNLEEQVAAAKHFGEWSDAEVTEKCDNWSAVITGRIVVARDDSVEAAVDTVMAYRSQGVVSALRNGMARRTKLPRVALEDWIDESLAADVLIRLKGSYLPKFVSDGRYADESRDYEGSSGWLRRVWRLHDLGVLPPIKHVVQRDLNQLDTFHSTAGYAFLVYLFEREPDDAATFFQLAVYGGSAAAARVVYEESLDDLDRDFRKWLDVARYGD